MMASSNKLLILNLGIWILFLISSIDSINQSINQSNEWMNRSNPIQSNPIFENEDQIVRIQSCNDKSIAIELNLRYSSAALRCVALSVLFLYVVRILKRLIIVG